jgi:dihydrofolate synthase / folylpolyglutamate synthase
MHPDSFNLQWFDYIKRYGSKPGLEAIKELLAALGGPQNSFDVIHITGTNGKGSTTAMTSSILKAAGYKTGMFTSPHLSSITESIKVNGIEISKLEMGTILGNIRDKINVLTAKDIRHPTQFEVLVAVAYTYFNQQGVKIAVIEVGMGGKSDATNVVNSIASIITNVSLEHKQWLGETVEEIAINKAGILKEKTVLITAVSQPKIISLLRSISNEKECTFISIEEDFRIIEGSADLRGQTFTLKTQSQTLTELTIPLLGPHQLINAACAIAAINVLNHDEYQINLQDIRNGLEKVSWPGRFEIMQQCPLFIIDGAKDPEAINSLVKTVKQYLPHRNIVCIFGVSSDKDYYLMISRLSEITENFIFTEHRVENRTTKARHLKELAEKIVKTSKIINPISKAIQYAEGLTKPNDVVLITGSVFLVGEAREYWYPQLSNSG